MSIEREPSGDFVVEGDRLHEAIARQMPGARPSTIARAQDMVISSLSDGIDRGGIPAIVFADGSMEIPWLRERVQIHEPTLPIEEQGL